MDTRVAPDLVERFRADLAAVWPEGGRLGVAVSGGPDSLALLLLAQAALRGVEAATVDHRLRPESADEAALVSRLCAELGVPHAVLPVEVPTGNLQGGARAERYAALSTWAADRGLDAVATAHHADDQAETLLMRLNRASGFAGLAGVRPRATLAGVTAIRPLLGWRRAELQAICAKGQVAPVADPSNVDPRFDRARIRAHLADARWIDAAALAASAAHLREASEALEWAAEREWHERAEAADGGIRYRPAAPRVVRLRVLERAIEALGGRARGGQVAQLEAALSAAEGGNVAGILARCEGEAWVLRPEPPRSR